MLLMLAHMDGISNDHRVVIFQRNMRRPFKVQSLRLVALTPNHVCHVFSNLGRLTLGRAVLNQDLGYIDSTFHISLSNVAVFDLADAAKVRKLTSRRPCLVAENCQRWSLI